MSGLDLWGVGGQQPRLMGDGPQSGGLSRGVRELGGSTQIQPEGGEGSQTGGFDNLLVEAIQEVKGASNEVKDKVERLAAGEPVKLHDILMAMGKSGETFNLMLEIRNKMMDAWQTLQRSVV